MVDGFAILNNDIKQVGYDFIMPNLHSDTSQRNGLGAKEASIGPLMKFLLDLTLSIKCG